jgi:hypothetical protein
MKQSYAADRGVSSGFCTNIDTAHRLMSGNSFFSAGDAQTIFCGRTHSPSSVRMHFVFLATKQWNKLKHKQ